MNALAASNQTDSFIGYPNFFFSTSFWKLFYFSAVHCKNYFVPILYSELFQLHLSLM